MKFALASKKLGTIATLILICCARLTTRADYQSTVLSQNPVGYWRLNETTQPPTPRAAANNGSVPAADGQYLFGTDQAVGRYQMGPIRGEPGALPGISNSSVRFFNPTMDAGFGGSKIEIPFRPALNPNGPFSVEFWAKPSSVVTNAFCTVASIDSDPSIAPAPPTDPLGGPRAGWLFYLTTNSLGTNLPNEWQFRMGNAASNTGPSYIDADSIRGGVVTPGAWHHIAGTYDGTNATLYVNGQQVIQKAINGYQANNARPFRIGTTCFNGIFGDTNSYAGNRGFDGWIQEVAFYGSALSAGDIAAHYGAGKTNGPAYSSVVLGNKPLGYWRLGEPGNPSAANLGSLAASGDGQYIYSAHPGQGGPPASSYPGFEANNKACAFSGTNGFVDLPPLNLNTNTVTITAWILASETEAHDVGIVFSSAGTTVAGLKFDISDPNGLSYNWNADEAAYAFKSDLAVPVFQWSFVALIVQPDQATLCLQDGTQFSTKVNFNTHPEQAFEGDTAIGTDTSDPTRTFHGIIDEVAIFNRALSVGDVYTEYASAVGNLKPTIFTDVQTPADTVYTGDTLNLTVDAGGTPPLSYQWRKDGNPIQGATSSNYSKAGVGAGDAGNYDVIVSNAQGQLPSKQASITIQPLAQPAIIQDPQGRTVYQGGLVKLVVQATGGGLSYQWQKNGTNIAGATNATYTVASGSGSDSGTYQVIVSNALNTIKSVVTSVNVIVPVSGSYEEIILGDQPESWWRLDEPVGSVTLTDAMGRHDGAYKGGYTLGTAGAIVGETNTAVTFDGSSGYGEVPFSKALNTPNFTVECWVKAAIVPAAMAVVGSFTQPPGRGYLVWKSFEGTWWYLSGDGIDPRIGYIAGADAIYDKWTYLTITYDGSDFIGYLNGALDTGFTGPFTPNNVAPFRIGYDQPGDTWNDFWNGDIDEVAVYPKALTADQIAAHYAAALYAKNTKPIFVKDLESKSTVVGSRFIFSPTVEGSVPMGFQWTKNNAALPNETNSFLVLTNADFTNSGTYQLTATNSGGTTLSQPATLAVLPQPSFANVTNGLVLHLAFDGDLLDSSGHKNNGKAVGAPAFVDGAVGNHAIHCSTTVDASDPMDPVVLTADYVSLGTPPDLQFSSNVNFSISYWVRFTGKPGDLPFFCNAVNAFNNPGYTFAPSYRMGGWSWGLGDVNSVNFIGVYGNDEIDDGIWHHLVHTFDRAGSGKTYLDGKFVDTRSTVGAGDVDSGEETAIGQDPTGGYPEAADLDIDDIGVWRRILTDFEVAAIYSAGQQGTSFDTVGPVTLAVSGGAGAIQLVWQAGTLLEAPETLGPWTPVNGASPPYYQVTPGPGRKFYRVQLK